MSSDQEDVTLLLSPCFESSGELSKILMPGSHPSDSDLNGLRCSLVFRNFQCSASDSNLKIWDYTWALKQEREKIGHCRCLWGKKKAGTESLFLCPVF